MASSKPSRTAVTLLARQLKDLENSELFLCGLVDDDNLFEWNVMIMMDEKSRYRANDVLFLNARLSFPSDFPYNPPKMRFLSHVWHPNVYTESGEVCISILHPPEEDKWGYEDISERWNPVHTVETILLSVISLLNEDPKSFESPANIDAFVQARDHPKDYDKKVKELLAMPSRED